MSKDTINEKVAKVLEDESLNDEVKYVIEDLMVEIETLKEQLENRKVGDGRKMQVLELLKANGRMTIKEIAKALAISTKNVSSQLTYLRTDGYHVCTDHQGFKFLLDE